MRKIIFLATMLFGTHVCAQLVVDSLGRVGIGNETPHATLSIKGITGASTVEEITQGNASYGLWITSIPTSTSNYNSSILTKNLNTEARVLKDNKHIGICSFVRSNSFSNPALSSIGIMGEGFGARTSIGVYGKASISNDSTKLAAGIYGAVGSHTSEISGAGRYAGYFYGPVKVTGKIYGTVYSPTTTSSTSLTNTTKSVYLADDTEEMVIDKLMSVQTLQFVREENTYRTMLPTENSKIKVNPTSIETVAEEDVDIKINSENPLNGELIHETEMVKHYGVDAEQLKTVFPELVTQDQQGDYCVNYSEMVPLLLQSIRELSAKVEKLEENQGIITQKAKAKSTSTDIVNESADIDIVHMSQNTPNPFCESSVITLQIPPKANNASIQFYNLNGKRTKEITIKERGETNVTVYASDLAEGMFIYSLLIDGKVQLTRKMIIVKN